MRRFSRGGVPDYFFISIVAILAIFGLVMLSSASSDLAKARFGDSYYYIEHQIMNGLLVGIAGFLLGMFVPLKVWEKSSVWLFLGSIVLLILVFFPMFGIEMKGSERWLDLGFVSFQPGEVLKLTFLLFLSSWVARDKDRSKSVSRGLIPFLLILGVSVGLLFLQPATTIAVILTGAVLAAYFAAGAKIRYIVSIMLLGAISVAGLIYVTPYRLQRIKGFLDPESDPLGATYHINQSLTAIGSGGLWGVGFGNSTTKLKYLPEPIGDSIFAVIGEEFGFVGALFVISLFALFIWKGFMIAKNSRDVFSRSLGVGLTSLIGIQAFINIGAISGLIPLTGVPLPFVSYGGTALAVSLTMCGILANISRSRR